jgi:FkbM family methyltransferase
MTKELHSLAVECKEKGVELTKLSYCSAIDQEWFSLQSNDCFYACNPILSAEACGFYSDNNCDVAHQKRVIETTGHAPAKILSSLPVDSIPMDIKDYSIAKHDGLSYYVNDSSFEWHINNGISQPYGTKEIDFVKQFLLENPGRNRTYIDVGMHFGSTILPYGRMFNRAYGYEPNEENFFLAKHNIALNNVTNTTIKNCAVSDRVTHGKTVQRGSNTGCYIFDFSTGGSINTVRLDDEGLQDVDFIKIDIEGAELLALKGAINLIQTYKPLLQIEINGLSEKHFSIQTSDILTFLHDQGYKHIGSEFYAYR